MAWLAGIYVDPQPGQPFTSRAELNKEGKSAINLSNFGNFCQTWPQVIYLC